MTDMPGAEAFSVFRLFQLSFSRFPAGHLLTGRHAHLSVCLRDEAE